MNGKEIFLQQNYRSTKNILEASNRLIQNNIFRLNKILWTLNEEGAPIVINAYYDQDDEHAQQCAIIESLLESTTEGKIGILTRSKAVA